jgi:hypothetical protein
VDITQVTLIKNAIESYSEEDLPKLEDRLTDETI